MLEFKSLELRQIGNDEVNSVDMREIHKMLMIKKDYTDWMKSQIKRGFFEENIDYVLLPQKGEKNKALYIGTLDTAKAVSLLSQTPKGKEIRQYFINVEKIAKAELGQEKLTLELSKLESDAEMAKLAVDTKKIEMVQLLNSMGANLDPIAMLKSGEFKRTLPKDIGEIMTSVATEIRHDVRAYSATYLLKKFKIDIKTPEWNDFLIEMGIMETYLFNSKTHKKFTDRTNYYGYNKYASSVRELPYQVVYYEDKFLDLVQLLRNEGYLD